jgi:hypothetical protein
MDEGEFYLFKKMNETFYKVIIMMVLFLALSILAFTAFDFYRGEFSESKLSWHMFTGTSLLLLAFLHMLTKKNKIKKLLSEFMQIILGRDIKHTNNKKELLRSVESKSLQELGAIFRIDYQELIESLRRKKVSIQDTNRTLKEIAEDNKKDTYQLFVLILRLHVRDSSPIKG